MSTPDNKGFINTLINVGLGILVISILAFNIWHYVMRPGDPPHPMLATTAPEFDLPLLSASEKVALSQHRGKVVLLDFWATYCAPCKRQMPVLEELYKELPKDRFSIISINTDNARSKNRVNTVSSYVQKGGYTFPVVLDNGHIAPQYKITRIPTLMLVDPEGNIQRAHTGFSDKSLLLDEVEELLEGKYPDNS